MSAPLFKSIAAARKALSGGQCLPSELISDCLERIASDDEALKAWLYVDESGALEAARTLDSQEVGDLPLGGIPLGVKDVIDVARLPTTAASRVLSGNFATRDSQVVALLKRAGAIVLGKTNTHEFAYGYVSPPTSNPWNLERISGGSSGGSAVALAAGHVLAALGTDTGGSIRIPAAFCGISGLKPQPGIVSMDGVIPLAPTLDVAGPMARSVEDLAVLWGVLGNAKALPVASELRFGIPIPGALPELDSSVAGSFELAVAVLRGLAKFAGELAVPSFEDFEGPRSGLLMPQALDLHRQRGWWPDHADLYTDEVAGNFRRAESFDAARIGEAETKSTLLCAQLRAAFGEVDVLVTPTSPVPAPTHQQASASDDEDRRPVARLLGRLPSPVNMAGLAAISVPCSLTSSGMPVGLQMIALTEEPLLALGSAFEKASPAPQLPLPN